MHSTDMTLYTIQVTEALLLALGSLLSSSVSLGRLLLGLRLLLSGIPGQGLLQDLENLFVGNLLVSLVLAEVELRGTAQLGDAVLGDGCRAHMLAQPHYLFRHGETYQGL